MYALDHTTTHEIFVFPSLPPEGTKTPVISKRFTFEKKATTMMFLPQLFANTHLVRWRRFVKWFGTKTFYCKEINFKIKNLESLNWLNYFPNDFTSYIELKIFHLYGKLFSYAISLNN